MGCVESKEINTQPKDSASLWVITRDFRESLSLGNELCVTYKQRSSLQDSLDSKSEQRINEGMLM